MEKLLDQDQINAMFRSARGGASSVASPNEARPQLVVSAYDLRQTTHLTKEQVRSITSLHESVGRNLSNSLGAYLRVVLEVDVVSVEQLTYAEFLGRLADITYLCSLNVTPMNSRAVLQLDLSLAFPLIDILLGGQGQAVNEVREATEIEEELLEGVVSLISRELDSAWSAAEIGISFDERQLPAAVQRLYPPAEKTLVICFELRIAQARGMLNLAFPAVVANTLLRKLLRDLPDKASAAPRPESAIRELMLDCGFTVGLRTPRLQVRFADFIDLELGGVLRLPYSIQLPLTIGVGDQDLFLARPVRTARSRGAQLLGQKRLPAGNENAHE